MARRTSPIDNDGMTLGDLIREEKKRRGISERSIGELLINSSTGKPATQPVVNRWTMGQSVPSADYLPALAQFLDLPLTEVRRRAADEQEARSRRSINDRLARLEADVAEIRRLIASRPPGRPSR